VSFSQSFTIFCDNCDDIMEEREGEPTEYDIQAIVEREYGIIEIEINGDFYEHLCPGCTEQTRNCDWCENDETVWEDDAGWCGDATFIYDHECLQEYHTQALTDGNIELHEEGDCQECGWTFPESPREQRRPALVTL